MLRPPPYRLGGRVSVEPLVVARTSDTLITVPAVLAYQSGVEVLVLCRRGVGDERPMRINAEVHFADGRSAQLYTDETNAEFRSNRSDDDISGSMLRYDGPIPEETVFSLWVTPLPKDGEIHVLLSWLDLNLMNVGFSLHSTDVLAAARNEREIAFPS